MGRDNEKTGPLPPGREGRQAHGEHGDAAGLPCDLFAGCAEGPVRSADSVSIYLNDLAGIETMDAETERALALEVRAGIRAGKALEEGGELDEGQRSLLSEEADRGERARLRLIESQLGTVLVIAKRYYTGRVPLADMIQEGNIGLIQAVARFDPDRGARLSTFAGRHIIFRIRSLIRKETQGMIHIPLRLYKAREKAERYRYFHRMTNGGRCPTERETAARTSIPVRTLRQLNTTPGTPRSLNDRITAGHTGMRDRDALTFEDVVTRNRWDEDLPDMDDMVERSALADELRRTMRGMSLYYSVIIRLRFGLEDGNPRLMEEIGREVRGVSRQRIFRVEKDAINQMRMIDPGVLKSYYDCLD